MIAIVYRPCDNLAQRSLDSLRCVENGCGEENAGKRPLDRNVQR